MGMLAWGVAATSGSAFGGVPQDNGWTYQGRLKQGGGLYNGTADIQFKLFDTSSGGTQIGPTLVVVGLTISEGLFTALLDFGSGAFAGDERWLEIAVHTPANGGIGPFTTLAPRQKIASAPYALVALHGGGQWTPSGANLNYTAGSVSVGTTSSLAKLTFFPTVGPGGTETGLFVRNTDASNQTIAGQFMVDSGSGQAVLAQVTGATGSGRAIAGFNSSVNGFGGYFVGAKNYLSPNVGVGTESPESTLHVHKGSAGVITAQPNATMVLENSTNNYLNMFTPDAFESAILFGRPGAPVNNATGGIVYNSAATPDGLQFRTNGNNTRMVVNNTGNVGVGTGTAAPSHRLTIASPDAETVRLIGPLGAFFWGARLNFGDGDFAFVEEDDDDKLNFAADRFKFTAPSGGDASLILPPTSVSSSEMVDEPGLASTVGGNVTLAVNDPPIPMCTTTITTPGPGFIVALGYVEAGGLVYQSSNDTISMRFGISASPSAFAQETIDFDFGISEPAFNAPARGSVSMHSVYSILGAGSYTYYLLADKFSGDDSVGDARLTLIFVPTAYGPVTSALDARESGAAEGGPAGRPVLNDVALLGLPFMRQLNQSAPAPTPRSEISDLHRANERQQALIDQLAQRVAALEDRPKP